MSNQLSASPSSSKVVGIRFVGNAPALLEKAAADAGVSVSEFVRGLAMPTAIERAADRILEVHTRKLVQPLREFFRPHLIRELTSGAPEGATDTERVLASLPEQDPDTWLSDRASDLLAERPELVELARTDRPKAYKQALRLAQKEIGGERN